MTADRWGRIGELFEAALAQPEAERESFLDDACGSDTDLREEVRSLLAHHRQGSPLEVPAAGWIAGEVDEPEPVPATIARYRVLEPLGAGGMGIVYRAEDPTLGRKVALKVLAPAWLRDPKARGRFQREARAAAALDHPNICAVYEVGTTDEGRPFLAMPCYRGETLAAKIARRPLPVDQALDFALQIAAGLACAHAGGMVHRDIKPANLWVTDDGVVKILDFGIAKLAPEAVDWGQAKTMTGVMLGTAGYLAPEQIRGAAVDTRADLFALGTVLFEMLTGVRPFRREHLVETLHAVLHDPPSGALAQCDDVPAPLIDVVMRLLEKAPEARFQSAQELTRALQAVDTRLRQGDGSSSARRQVARRTKSHRAAVFAPLVVMTILAAFVVQQRENRRSTAPLASPDVTQTASPNVLAEGKYLLGRVAVRRPTPEDLRNAERYFKEAIALDPDYADAWAGLASAYKRMPMTGTAPARTAFEQARVAADQALALDPNNAEAISAQGTIAFWYEWDYERAETLLRQALTLQPDHADSHLFLAHVHSNTGRAAEALDGIRRAQSKDQQWAQARALEGQFLHMARRYDDALSYLDAVVMDIDPDNWTGHLIRAATLAELDRLDEALAAYDRVLTMQRHNPFPMALRAVVLARSGRRAEAEAALADVPEGFHYGRALALEAMDRGDEAMAELRAAIEARDPLVTFLGIDPRWDSARRRPAFRDLVRRVNLLEVSDRFVR